MTIMLTICSISTKRTNLKFMKTDGKIGRKLSELSVIRALYVWHITCWVCHQQPMSRDLCFYKMSERTPTWFRDSLGLLGQMNLRVCGNREDLIFVCLRYIAMQGIVLGWGGDMERGLNVQKCAFTFTLCYLCITFTIAFRIKCE